MKILLPNHAHQQEMGKWTPIHAQCFREEEATPLFWCPLPRHTAGLDFLLSLQEGWAMELILISGM